MVQGWSPVETESSTSAQLRVGVSCEARSAPLGKSSGGRVQRNPTTITGMITMLAIGIADRGGNQYPSAIPARPNGTLPSSNARISAPNRQGPNPAPYTDAPTTSTTTTVATANTSAARTRPAMRVAAAAGRVRR